MSAPIDELLFDDDDPGDETLNEASNGLQGSMLSPSAALGMSAPISAPEGILSSGESVSSSLPEPPSSMPVSAPAPTPAPAPATVAPSAFVAPTASIAPSSTASTGAASTPSVPTSTSPMLNNGQEMFKKMFELLQKLLPPDKYLALHKELKNVDGNNVKAIVDTIKHVVGDKIFASVIQKMDTSKQPATTTSAPVSAPGSAPQSAPVTSQAQVPIKPEPQATANKDTEAKIKFAKQLLFHATKCAAGPGQCQVKKCEDVRRVFKHSVTCGATHGCTHCDQLKGLVKYHAKDCTIALNDKCPIPFCDGLRQTYQPTKAKQPSDDEDNTPLSAAKRVTTSPASKAKVAKSPPAAKPTPVMKPAAPIAAKRKPSVSQPPTSRPSVPASNPKPSAPASGPAEYGRMLQLILHVQQCNTSTCPVGEECAEAKSLLKQMNAPNAPKRAQTFKEIYSHYKMCQASNNTNNCPVCKIGLQPIVPAASPSLKRSGSSTGATPRSPVKKAKVIPPAKGRTDTTVEQELAQANASDIRKEADVLTHTNVELAAERKSMMEGAKLPGQLPERLASRKAEWAESDLFKSDQLTHFMRQIASRQGVQLGTNTSEVMSYALHEYLKQAMEEMVEISKQRGDSCAQSLEQIQPRPGRRGQMQVTGADLLRVSSNDSFARMREEDLSMRSKLLEEGKKEEQLERERSKKRKKADKGKQPPQDERDEGEMDVSELAKKDLKERLLQDDKKGVVKVDGRVNESITQKHRRRDDSQLTMADATFWLRHQKPHASAKLFVRADAARVVTKSL